MCLSSGDSTPVALPSRSLLLQAGSPSVTVAALPYTSDRSGVMTSSLGRCCSRGDRDAALGAALLGSDPIWEPLLGTNPPRGRQS